MLRAVFYDGVKTRELNYEDAVRASALANGLVWLDVPSPGERDIRRLSKDFGLHPSAAEDWFAPLRRPGVKDYGGHLLLTLTVVDDDLETHDIFVFAGRHFILTFHHGEIATLKAAFRTASDTGANMTKGADYLLFCISDSLIDTFFPVLDGIDMRVAAIENKILADPRERVPTQLFEVKRQCLHLRKVLGPLRDIFTTLSRVDIPLIRPEMRPYFISIYDHILRLHDTVDTYRDLLTSALEVYLSAQSNRMNEVMKTLTIIATIMMPLTVITGIYGMNFRIPELEWRFGYHTVLFSMGLIVIAMLVWFRKRKWL